MSLTASVVSAAILEGNLIIGLSDGSVINCGYVQGPPGLKGDPGPMGADGDAGRDGNTIITVAGTPRNDAGKDGDYAIDNVNWRIYGPKSGGTWGKANNMLPGKENLIANGRGFEGGASGGGGGGSEGGGSPTTYGNAFPASPSVGDQHVMDDTLYEYVYTGGAWLQIVSPGGGGGGATTLGQLTDVNLTGTQEGDVLLATASNTWKNNPIDGGTF
mgnify:CR=1 FL=1|jgi:hypothetical protein